MKRFSIVILAILLLGTSRIAFGQSESEPDYDDAASVAKKPVATPVNLLNRFGLKPDPVLTAAAKKSGLKVLLTFRRYEINDTELDEATRKKMAQKFSAGGSSAFSNPSPMPTDEILSLMKEVIDAGHGKLIFEKCMASDFERESRIFDGDIIDLDASSKEEEIVVLATAKDGQLSTSDFELLKKPKHQFLGLWTSTTAGISENNELMLNVTTNFSRLNGEHHKDEKINLVMRRSNLGGITFAEGQSTASYWPSETRQVSVSTPMPVIGSIPYVGPRYFARNKIKPHDFWTLLVFTPEIVDPKQFKD